MEEAVNLDEECASELRRALDAALAERVVLENTILDLRVEVDALRGGTAETVESLRDERDKAEAERDALRGNLELARLSAHNTHSGLLVAVDEREAAEARAERLASGLDALVAERDPIMRAAMAADLLAPEAQR